ncbi:MAG: FAD/NAD(P)-binding protein [Methylacidiphilales bacterium]|nr:FAD/NAD(P)-binding protein [Candidatus Methylacidiphilales bacterium]
MNELSTTISQPEEIAIIGGGFSGVTTAVNLARLSRQPLRLTIINQHRPTARGMAYGTRRMEHLLNVAARNMSAFPDLPDHFLQWPRTRSEYDTAPEVELRERFIPRMIYGDYLRSLMHQHLQAPSESVPVRTTFIEGEAVDVEPHAGGAVIHLSDGARVEASRIVLATGNESPSGLPGCAELQKHPAWVGHPWQPWENRLPASGGTVLLLGTGLTTVDAVITLRMLGWQGVIHAVSRNGWLPHPHFRGIEYPDFPPPGVDLADLGLNKLVALVEHHCARLRELGANPAIIVDKMRPYTQRIWQRFSMEERQEFTQRYAARWNVLRHRIAPDIHAQLTTAQLTGQLQIHAASIECVRADGNQVRVYLTGGKTLTGDLVINATGPNTRFTATGSVLLQNLIRRGLVTCDELEMGARVDADHTIIGRDGQRSELLLALGPLLRGTLWETIAVPELRVQARRTAETLLNHPVTHVETPPPVMMEYMI